METRNGTASAENAKWPQQAVGRRQQIKCPISGTRLDAGLVVHSCGEGERSENAKLGRSGWHSRGDKVTGWSG